MTVLIGANPIGWSNDDLRELGGHIPLETCLAEARAAGFSGMELGHKFPRKAAALWHVLSRHDLDLVSAWSSSSLLTPAAPAPLATRGRHTALPTEMGARVRVFGE